MLKAKAQCEEHFDSNPLNEQWTFYNSNIVINTNEQLQLQDNGSGCSSVSWNIGVCGDTLKEWQFYIKQNFAGSSNNFGKIYFGAQPVSDSTGFDESSNHEGYVLRMGSPGSTDHIEWLRDDGNGTLTPLADGFNIANGINGWIKIKKQNGFECYFKDNDSTDYSLIFSSADTTFENISVVTFQFHYTASNSQNFYIDDCYVGPYYVAPTLYIASPRDVVINEIMADPSPSRGLPEVEYVELHNTLPFAISLTDWKWVNSTTIKTIPTGHIDSLGYVIVCDADAVFNFNVPVIGIESFGLLTNGGDSLSLISPQGQTIDFVVYSLQDYDPSGEEGGFSLEQICPTLGCSDHFNWKQTCASEGGTPGQSNCQFQNTRPQTPFTILDIGVDTLGQVFLWTPYPIHQDSVVLFNNEFNFIAPIKHLSDSAWFDASFLSNFPSGEMSIQELTSCLLDTLSHLPITITIPKGAEQNELVITEILSHPHDDSPSFVEVYNPVEHAISLDGISIGNSSQYFRSAQYHHHYILPHQAMCISENPIELKRQYPLLNPFFPQHHFSHIPYLTQSAGNVTLQKKSILIDYAHYDENWHHPLIQDPQGVSFEKVSIPCPSNDLCWSSGSAHYGFATPGVYWQEDLLYPQKLRDKWSIQQSYFSPNLDGKEDQFYLSWQGDDVPHTITIGIHQLDGSFVKSICQNEINLAPAVWQWNGLDHLEQMSPSGIYFLVIQDQTIHAKKTEFIKSIVLSP